MHTHGQVANGEPATRKTSEIFNSFLKGLMWSVFTIALALFVAFFIDFVVEIINSHGDTSLREVALISFNPHRIFEASIVLLSALIVEQCFAKFTSKVDTILIVVQFFILGAIMVVSSLHTFHLIEPREYQEILEKGYVLQQANHENSCMLDTVDGQNKNRLIYKQESLNDSLKAFWHQVDEVIIQKGIKHKCSCLAFSITSLIIVFLFSVVARTRMHLANRKTVTITGIE